MKSSKVFAMLIAGSILATTVHADNTRDQRKDAERTDGSAMVFASDLIKQKVVNADGREIGHIDELIVDPATGKIKFGVVSLGKGFMGLGNKSVTLPWDKLHARPNAEGYEAMIDDNTLRDSPAFVRTTYTDHYYATQLQTWHGTIDRIDAKAIKGNDTAVTAFQLRTDQGVVTVQADRGWMDQRDQLNLHTGDGVTVRGFTSGLGSENAIVAREISANGKTVYLSNDSAVPYRETSGDQK